GRSEEVLPAQGVQDGDPPQCSAERGAQPRLADSPLRPPLPRSGMLHRAGEGSDSQWVASGWEKDSERFFPRSMSRKTTSSTRWTSPNSGRIPISPGNNLIPIPWRSWRSRSRSTGSFSPSSFGKASTGTRSWRGRSEEHTSELQSRENLVCRLLLEKKKIKKQQEQISI